MYAFNQLLVLLVARSIQVSLPILLIMQLRNVCWADYGFVSFRPLKDAAIALGLTVLCYFANYALVILLYNLGLDYSGDSNAIPRMTTEASISLASILLIMAASAANGFCEELAMRSYLITRLSELYGSKVVAVAATSVFFAAYHIYQGRYGVIFALVVGLILGTYFARTKRFWPIAIAHFLMDAYPLSLIAAYSE